MRPEIYQVTLEYLAKGGARDLPRTVEYIAWEKAGIARWVSWENAKRSRVRICTCAVGRFTQDGVSSTSFSISAATVGSPMAIEISLRV